MSNQEKKLVFLGVGQVARALAQIVLDNSQADKTASNYKLFGTTRSAERVAEIRKLGIEPLIIETFEVVATHLDDALVVVSFPPNAEADDAACRAAKNAAGIVYISSTAVYGKREGLVDENTDVESESPHAKARLDAEQKWLQVGASIVRAPGIYGGGNGMHHRLLSGNYRLPGDGSNFVSRIHVHDLASMIVSVLELNQRGRIYLAGDNQPTTHKEIVEWLVQRLNLPFPDSIPLEQCHYTQRGNRRVDASKSIKELGVTLKFPTYKDGYSHELNMGT